MGGAVYGIFWIVVTDSFLLDTLNLVLHEFIVLDDFQKKMSYYHFSGILRAVH